VLKSLIERKEGIGENDENCNWNFGICSILGFTHHDAQKSDNLAAKAASALVTTK